MVFLNSSLNPVIYCLKMRQFRRAVMALLRNIFANIMGDKLPRLNFGATFQR